MKGLRVLVERERYGIMGGTFNPIHYGHLVTAEAARAKFDLRTVIFVPTGVPPHKADQVAPAEDRFQMTVMATADNPAFLVSRTEIDRPGTSYTIDTLLTLRQTYGAGADFYFISGADAVWEILAWKDPDKLVDLCKFIAASRPGYDMEKFKEWLMGNPGLPEVYIMEIPALAISSTDLRERVKHGRPIRYLLPDAVVEYIDKKRLYK